MVAFTLPLVNIVGHWRVYHDPGRYLLRPEGKCGWREYEAAVKKIVAIFMGGKTPGIYG
jgi:hypothetical protein